MVAISVAPFVFGQMSAVLVVGLAAQLEDKNNLEEAFDGS
ncbi:hypothetical protein BN77_1371 [Rhizobium mesoamericanum STM3625]|uniref:Uncharacterized protein n=1 Tax=Rhizobium mesoamericanum STM3625 TaxID=1211777 RepID=K0PK09_9HYPH|nr:hypothetical protein BN77_1371 [Rhizobium mesoamericanum STM3625]